MYVRMSVAIPFLTFLIASTITALVPYTNASSKSDNPNVDKPSGELTIKVDSPYDKAKYCLYDSDDNQLDCKELDGPAITAFYTDNISVGEKIKVCDMYADKCKTGENGEDSEPEYIIFD